jgi:hypothetical protein
VPSHRLSPRIVYENNISVFEGSGGNVAALTGPDGNVFIDVGIGVSLSTHQSSSRSSADSVAHAINTLALRP